MVQSLRNALAIVASPLVLAACVSKLGEPGTLLASTPPGARIVVDGEDSGYVTPHLIAIDDDSDHVVSLELGGYEPAVLALDENTDWWVVRWKRGYAHETGWPFFLFLPIRDLFAPVKVDTGLEPGRVHVHLEPRDGG